MKNLNATALNDTNTQHISVYPNPFDDKIMINYDSSETLHISVTDLNGREVLAKDLTSGNTEIDTRALTGGLFLLKAVNDKGMYITKVIKAK